MSVPQEDGTRMDVPPAEFVPDFMQNEKADIKAYADR